MLSALINTTEHGSTPTTPPHHTSSNLGGSTGIVSPSKRKASLLASSSSSSSQRKRSPLSPTKTPARALTPDTPPRAAAATSSVSPATATTTPARTAPLGKLLNATDIPPRPSTAASVDADDADDVEADVSMRDADEDEHMEDVTFTQDAPGDAHNRLDEDEDEEADEAEEPEEGEDGETEDEEDDDDDEDDEDSGDDSDGSEDIILVDGPPSAPTGDVAPPVKPEPVANDGDAPTDGDKPAAEGEAAGEVVNELKPKKKGKRARRSPSSDEDIPPPPPPVPTIRLETEFKPDEETLDWNFIEHAAQAGFHVTNAWGEEPPVVLTAGDETTADTPAEGALSALSAPPGLGALGGPSPLGMTADDEAREMEEIARRLEEKYDKPTKKTKKRRVIDYDLNDPFIDDSDLKIDAPTHVARPKKEGFFVHMGTLELMEESPQKKASRSKPKAKKEVKEPRTSLAAAIRTIRDAAPNGGTAHSPITIDSDNEAGPSSRGLAIIRRSPSPSDTGLEQTRIDRTLFKSASRDPKYLPPFDDFPEAVAHAMRALRRESAAHVWDVNNKGKFPEHLKVPLKRAGDAAMQHELLCIADKKDTSDSNYDKYQEKSFVTALCSVLPYNRLTLGKLVLKMCYPDYWRWLQDLEAEGLRQWRELLDPEIPGMLEAWDLEQANQAAHGEDMLEPEPPMLTDGDDASGKDKDKSGGGGDKDKSKRIPVFTPEMKDIFKQLVENTQEMVDVNKKMEEWHQKIEGQSSELNMRKALYSKISKLYPDGWMTSLTLSRAYTNYKRSGAGASKAAAREDTAQ